MRSILCTLLLLSCANVSYAVIETYEFSSSSLEQRYRQLSVELRCPKCQNQNIADSNAPIAQDLRKLLYKQLEAGASDEEILDYMVSRYGEFVRYKPRFSGVTLMLWLMPVALLLGAIIILFSVLRGSRKEEAAGGISAEEQRQLDKLLENDT
ncbi:MAG: cytochrome c-type biogenesis protein CcmH [Proteobacteria bacterium]|nr:cytochrome c-type biogenesis protein CcmH [Pseudomonadota bacterium]